MSRGIHESPMDFEFQNGTGPMDGRSPFAQLSQNTQRFPMSEAKKREQTQDVEMSDAVALTSMAGTGSYNAFDSPAKPRSTQPSSPSKPLPPTPAFNSLFTTPRKTQMDIDDSSAGETPKSPEQNQDSDAPTPDYRAPNTSNLRSALTTLGAVSMPATAGAERPERSSPAKEKPGAIRRDSWMVRVKNKLYSPGRGEVARLDHPNTTDKRIEKRRRRELDRKASRRRRHSISSDDGDADESELPPISPRKTSSKHLPSTPDAQQPSEKEPFWLTKLFTFIAQHPTVPHILSFYAQLLFNIFLLTGCAYLCYCFWAAVQGDVDKKSHEAMADIMAEMAACAEQFTKNQCDRATRMPALETVCENWSKCMNQNPAHVGRARVSAHTFAEIFNSFVEPISYKAMFFTAILVFGCFAISNMAFSFFRKSEGQAPAPTTFGFGQGGYYQQPPPPTPQRSFSGPGEGFYAGTPWQQNGFGAGLGLEPAPSGGFGQIDGRGSPVRRLKY